MQYAQDYDERMVPPANSDGISNGWASNWIMGLQPYVKSEPIFVCPSDLAKDLKGSNLPNIYFGQTPTSGRFRNSYGYNWNFQENTSTSYSDSTRIYSKADAGARGALVTKVTNPATTVLATDVGGAPDSSQSPPEWFVEKYAIFVAETQSLADVYQTHSLPSGTDYTSIAQAWFSGPLARHLETTNVLWFDGHVKAQKVESFYKVGNVTENSTSGGVDSPCFNLDQSAAACK